MSENDSAVAPSLTGIILAAGCSDRFGRENKLLLPLGDRSIVRSVISRIRNAGVDDVIVVTGHERSLLEQELSSEDVRILFNPEFRAGMGSSIVRGVRGSVNPDGVLIIPGDMPLIAQETFGAIARAWSAESIIVPAHYGRRGHPVLFGAVFRQELLELPFDRGARSVLDGNPEKVIEIEVDDPFIHRDIDTIGDYEEALRSFVRSSRDV